MYQTFQRLVVPYATGNLHPRFMGWVHGGGNPVGMLAEMLAGGLNASNVAIALGRVRQFGVDLCNGVRTGGWLDPARLAAFVDAVG